MTRRASRARRRGRGGRTDQPTLRYLSHRFPAERLPAIGLRCRNAGLRLALLMASTHETALEAMSAGREAGVTDDTPAREEPTPGARRRPSYAELYPEWRAANPIRERWQDRTPKPMRDTSGMTYDEYRTYLYDRWGMTPPPLTGQARPSKPRRSKLVVALQERVAELERLLADRERVLAKHGISTVVRRCEWDRKPLPDDARAGTRYCSTRCRVAAHRAGRA
jgi:hypothetical protein